MPHYLSTDALLATTRHKPHTGEWFEVAQQRIAAFADATDDHQWIHLHRARAAAGPFGTTIAHGYLTLSLLPRLLHDAIEIDGLAMRINYGLDNVRLTNVVRADSRVRALSHIIASRRVPSGVRVEVDVTVEIEGSERPALRATQILLLVEETA
ncbi:MaoC family dehydratase [Microbacterium esteraromaticum]|uniref:MaoC family dehydratase n=1 Tax=Microbacterium esteraromaticum TaxID=57043 RepID=UPI001C942721|nr:MaoC family dehydratase [Microbacterium esteraromaticum]MBY6060982.1 MaoC family dehydratase [Microbacterium esteraromaticum]